MTPKIHIAEHRGKQAFRWYINGRCKHRVIKDPKNIDHEKLLLAAELLTGTSKKEARKARKSLPELLDLWAADLRTVSPKQASLTSRRARRVIKESGVRTLGEFSVARFRTAIHQLKSLTHKKAEKPLSENSRNYHAKALKQLAKWLVDEGYLAKNPLAKWQTKKPIRVVEENPRDRFQPQELAALVQAVASDSTFCGYEGQVRAYLYTLAAMTGLRRKELATLTPDSFDWRTNTVVVQRAYTKDSETAVLPVNSDLARSLRRWCRSVEGPLFPGLKNKPTDKMIKRDLKLAGVPHESKDGVRCFHSLRNTYISSLFDAGISLPQIQKLARHGSVDLTMKYAKPKSGECGLVDQLPNPLTVG